MALITLNIASQALKLQTEVKVIMPQKVYEEGGFSKPVYQVENIRVLYLLHGLSDDQTFWARKTSIERYAEKYGICVVMPFADRSFYCDMKYGLDYYTYIAKELPVIIHDYFNVSDKPEDTCIAGLSMGGYGALKIALREKGKFRAVAGLSSVQNLINQTHKHEKEMINCFGEDLVVPPEDDLLKLIEKRKGDADKPRIFLGVGTEDWLYKDSQTLRTAFSEAGYDLTYTEGPGIHDWYFWDEAIQKVLKWMFE